MKIAIFENEYESVKGAFETANLMYFEDKLELVIYPSSQKAELTQMEEFKVIFIDIDLSSKSDLDGFTLIEKLNEINKDLINRIVILTGNNKIKEALKIRSIDITNIQIIIKPTNFEEINNCIVKIKSNAQQYI